MRARASGRAARRALEAGLCRPESVWPFEIPLIPATPATSSSPRSRLPASPASHAAESLWKLAGHRCMLVGIVGVVFGLLQWWHGVAARSDTAAAETRSAELVSEVASLREQFRGQHEDRQPREQERDRKRRTRETGRPQQEVDGCWQPHCGQVTEMLALIGRRDAALVSLMNAEMRADDQEPPSARSPVTMSACSRAAVSATTASHHMAGTSAAQQIPRRVRGLRSHRRNLAAAYSLRS
jgi:hypothetical protein